MAYRVDISPSALRDAEDAYLWLRKRAPRAAAIWHEGLVDAICSLEDLPSRCALAPEGKDLGMAIRQLLYAKKSGVYRILFVVVDEDVVRVLRIRHGARASLTPDEIDPSDLS